MRFKVSVVNIQNEEHSSTDEWEQPHVQENIPNDEWELPHVQVGQIPMPPVQGDESSILGGNIEKIKKNIEQKELAIEKEKAKLRVVDKSLICFSKTTLLMNLLSSHVPLEENPLNLQSLKSTKIKKQVKELFGKSVPAVAVFLGPSYTVIDTIMPRLAPDYELHKEDDSIYFKAKDGADEHLIPLKGMWEELEQLKSEKERLEKRLQELRGSQ